MSISNNKLMIMTVDDVLKQWPQTAPVFRKHGLACVGCIIARFCEIGKVAEIYNLPPEQLLHDLHAVINQV